MVPWHVCGDLNGVIIRHDDSQVARRMVGKPVMDIRRERGTVLGIRLGTGEGTICGARGLRWSGQARGMQRMLMNFPIWSWQAIDLGRWTFGHSQCAAAIQAAGLQIKRDVARFARNCSKGVLYAAHVMAGGLLLGGTSCVIGASAWSWRFPSSNVEQSGLSTSGCFFDTRQPESQPASDRGRQNV
ncbi:hypothetical protein COCVIDRAFT_21138 [Bipolaris victoriae FI3]|uniref:Uncharacterized protein n=1 Tax=Bipolaris victoriae (strain FI3) TaxID=930091 RepID=W7E9S5_BIPV3|nr:hypothetical protein COCVIDRAFT_21138 [Bipolaris victoriae FI3]